MRANLTDSAPLSHPAQFQFSEMAPCFLIPSMSVHCIQLAQICLPPHLQLPVDMPIKPTSPRISTDNNLQRYNLGFCHSFDINEIISDPMFIPSQNKGFFLIN